MTGPLRLLALLAFINLPSLHATSGDFANFYIQFKNGAYVQALETLKRINPRDETSKALKEYLEAISLSRLQRFDEAIPHFENALRAKVEAEDFYYEFGQALYAANELERARVAFKKSYAEGFKRPTSLYYMGFISQILEEYPTSISYFDQILKDKEADTRSTQVAMFQKTESTLSLHKSKKGGAEFVEKSIIPSLEAAKKFDSASPTATDIDSRIKEIQREFGLDPTKYRNGRKIPDSRVSGSISQDVKYDNNITNSNGQPTVDTTNKDSFVFTTKAKLGGDIVLKRRYTISPEMQLSIVEHSDRDTAVVFTNDSTEYNPSVKFGYEHTVSGKPATLSYTADFKHKEQDVNRNKEKIFHSRTWTHTFGEKFKIFDAGDTGLKFKYKTFRSYSAPLDNDVKGFSIDQLIVTKKGHILLLLLSYDDTDNYNAPTNSTATTMLRADYLIPNIAPSYTIHMAMSLMLLDTKLQKSTRGTEVTYSPMLKFQKKISPSLKISADYTYSKNTSQSAAREYTKHVTSMQLRYSF